MAFLSQSGPQPRRSGKPFVNNKNSSPLQTDRKSEQRTHHRDNGTLVSHMLDSFLFSFSLAVDLSAAAVAQFP